MSRPGATIEIVEDAPSGQAVLDSGQAFFLGVAARGRSTPVRVFSLSDYEATFGARSGGSLLHDAVAAYFAEGGAVLYISTIYGATAAIAGATVGVYAAKAKGPGVWGNSVTLAIVDASAS